jgi:hypothetical protein
MDTRDLIQLRTDVSGVPGKKTPKRRQDTSDPVLKLKLKLI